MKRSGCGRVKAVMDRKVARQKEGRAKEETALEMASMALGRYGIV